MLYMGVLVFSHRSTEPVDCTESSSYLIRPPGPFFFHGFLRPVSRAREIENDAFHGHFTD